MEALADGLYGLPLEEFTRGRDEVARELRREGRREEADAVKALRKPSAAAASVNRLVREHRREVEAFLAAARRLRDAQFGGKGDVESATADERQTLAELVRLGGERVRGSLQAAAVDEGAASELLAARLVQELEPQGFGTLLAHVQPRQRGATREVAGARRRAERELKERVREAEAAVRSAEAAEKRARRDWQQAQDDLEAARRDLEQARSGLPPAADRAR
jgi:hypothetical protein